MQKSRHHTGKLGEQSTQHVQFTGTYHISIVGDYPRTQFIHLTSEEALSLLTWLEQERSTLEERAEAYRNRFKLDIPGKICDISPW